MSKIDRRNDREQMQYALGLLDGLDRARQMIEDGADCPFDDTDELLFLLNQTSDHIVETYKPFVEAALERP